MKIRLIFWTSLVAMIYSSTVAAQVWPHIPVAHGDTLGICWGYAVARAFHKFGHYHSECEPTTVHMTSIPATFFDHEDWDIQSVTVGDIIDFYKTIEQFPGGMYHVAFVSGKSSSTTSGITLAQLEYEDGPERTGYTLQQTIDGVKVGETWIVQPRGQPTSFWRLRPEYKLKLQNTLGNGAHTGTVKLDDNQQVSGYTYDDLHWDSDHTIYAVMHDSIHEGYVQKFDKWEKEEVYLGNSQQQGITINWNSKGAEPVYDGKYRDEYEVTLRNSFLGVSGYPGIIKVEGENEDSPHEEVVLQGNSITVQALNQVYNHISYTFSEWSDEYGSAQREIEPEGNETYTANYTGKPVTLLYNYNLHFEGDPGDYIMLVWNRYENDNVIYKVYRKVKHNGVVGNPVLLTTLDNDDTTYVDTAYRITEGYTDDICYFDVRAFYTTEQTYADEEWIDIFGELDGPKRSEPVITQPFEFEIAAYPNPFNPETTIRYRLKERAIVTLTILDMLGRNVATIAEGERSEGFHSIGWAGKDAAGNAMPSGVYFYRFTAIAKSGADIVRESGKLMLVK